MPQLFIRTHATGWSILPLAEDAYGVFEASRTSAHELTPDRTKGRRPSPRVRPAPLDRPTENGVLLVRSSTATDSGSWALLVGPTDRLRLNGRSVGAGLAILRHRDQLCLTGHAPMYYSTEVVARVDTYRADDEPICPRCTLAIEPGDAFVRCPGCQVAHHQRHDRACFTYADRCALCDFPSDLDSGFRWNLEGL